MTKEELKPIDVSKYTVTESGNVIKSEEKETTKEDFFRQNFSEYCVGDTFLSPYWDLFEAGYELKQNILSQRILELQADKGNLINRVKELEAQIEKMKVKWHDLEKDPNDLPKDYKTMCICLSDFGSKYEPVPRVCVGYCDSLGWSDYMGSSLYSTVRYWCELPQF